MFHTHGNGRTLPGVDDGNVVLDNSVSTLNGATLDKREEDITSLEGNGPVHEVKLNH